MKMFVTSSNLAPLSGTASHDPTISASDLRAALDAIVRNSLRPVAAGLSALFAVLALTDIFVLPKTIATPAVKRCPIQSNYGD
jgi:hypothetical protein